MARVSNAKSGQLLITRFDDEHQSGFLLRAVSTCLDEEQTGRVYRSHERYGFVVNLDGRRTLPMGHDTPLFG